MERLHRNSDSHFCLQNGVKGAHILTLATRLWGYGTVTLFEQGMHSSPPQSPPGPIVSPWGPYCLSPVLSAWPCGPLALPPSPTDKPRLLRSLRGGSSHRSHFCPRLRKTLEVARFSGKIFFNYTRCRHASVSSL